MQEKENSNRTEFSPEQQRAAQELERAGKETQEKLREQIEQNAERGAERAHDEESARHEAEQVAAEVAAEQQKQQEILLVDRDCVCHRAYRGGPRNVWRGR